jgi:hypothetical protein
MKFIFIAVLGLGVFFGFRLLNLAAKKLLTQSLYNRIAVSLPILELIAWIAFIFWSTSYTLSQKSYYPVLVVVLVVVLVILLAWFLVRDFIAGVLLKSQRIYKTGQIIKTAQYSGRITRMGNLHLSLQTEQGESARIPYSVLSNSVIIKQKQDFADTNTFSITVPQSLSKEEWIKKLETDILSSPWVSTKANPVIKITEETMDSFVFTISVVTLNPEHALHLETLLKKGLD